MQQDSQAHGGPTFPGSLPIFAQSMTSKRRLLPSFLCHSSGSFCTWYARMPIQTYRTAATISNAKAAFQQLQMFSCVRYASVSRLTPLNSCPVTYWLQLPLTLALDPYSCTAV